MVSIPPEKLQEVRDRVDIERVIGRTVALKRQGQRLVGLCPFHSEKTPSFSVDAVKKLYHCFGCQAGGDAIDFVKRIEGIDFADAVRLLAREFGIALPEREESPEEKRARSERDRLFRANELAAEFYHQRLWSEPKALAYLREERGLSDQTIRAWQLGFAPEGWSALSDALSAKQVPAEILVRAGLSAHRKDGRGLYDRLRGRIVFPIALPGGAIAGFGARRSDWLTTEDPGPKYLNSQESPIYEKSSILFGLSAARDPIRRHKRAVLVEGYLDVIALHQAGIDDAVATCGTALSGRHAAQLARLTPEVVTLYDGDPAGQAATRRAAEILLAAGVQVRVMTLPDQEDPDTYVRKLGGPAVSAQIGSARAAVDEILEGAIKRHSGGGIAGLVATVEEIRPILRAVKDPLQRDVLIQGAARRLRMEPRTLAHHLRQKDAPVELTRRDVIGVGPAPRKKQQIPGIEAALLRMMVERPREVAKEVEAAGLEEGNRALRAFSHDAIRAAMVAGVKAVRAGQPFDALRALEEVERTGATPETVANLRKTLLDAPPAADDIKESLKNLLRKDYERRLRELKDRIALEQDPEAAESLTVEVEALVRAKASLL